MNPKAALLATALLVSFGLGSGLAAQPGKNKWASANSRSQGDAFLPALSANGRSVAFLTRATNPIGRRVGPKSDGSRPAISGDGRYVAFSSKAAGLVADDTNAMSDIFVYDRETGTTTRVSVSGAGVQGDGVNSSPAFSADGRFVAFESTATNLVAGDGNAFRDIFVHDRQARTTERVSVDGSGSEANGASFTPALSADGRFVAFASEASNLVTGDTNDRQDIFVHDRRTGTTERVSIASDGAQGNGDSALPAISADGLWVAFISRAGNLVANDTKGLRDIFVHDRRNGTTERVSVHSAGNEGNGASGALSGPGISASGRFIVFSSLASNLVSGDGNGARDIFVHDRMKGSTERLNADGAGTGGNGASLSPAISGDGRYVAFASDASNLAAADTNAVRDIYVHDRGPDPAVAFQASSGAGLILVGGVESNGAERGPAFQLFGLTGTLRLTRFVVDPQFLLGVQFEMANLDDDAADEILVGGREPSSESDGPAFELYESDGSLKGSYPALNPDFTEVDFSAIRVPEPAVLACGTETQGDARGPALQLFDGNGVPLYTRFALNPDFRETHCSATDVDGFAGDELIVSAREVNGKSRGPAFQIFRADGSLHATRFVLNPDFSQLQVAMANTSGSTLLVAGLELVGKARGPAFQIFDTDGNLLLTRFALNPDFAEIRAFGANVDGVGWDEVVIGGRETAGRARGPAFQVFDADGTLRVTRFVLNPDFSEVGFSALDVNGDGRQEILVVGRETAGQARGPAFQLFDSSGNLLLTRFVLNPDFAAVSAFPVPRSDGIVDIGIGGFEDKGRVRGPAFQVWAPNGALLTTRFVLNPDF